MLQNCYETTEYRLILYADLQMCAVSIKIWLRKPICHLLTLSVNHRSLTKFSRLSVHFIKMHTIFLTSLVFQIFKEKNQQFLFLCLDWKNVPPSSNIFSSAFLHFHTLDLLWKWGTCISSLSIFFFKLEAEIQLVLLSAMSSQFSFDLFRRFPILRLLHVLLVKSRKQSILWSQEAHCLMNSACDEHHDITKNLHYFTTGVGNISPEPCKPLWELCW